MGSGQARSPLKMLPGLALEEAEVAQSARSRAIRLNSLNISNGACTKHSSRTARAIVNGGGRGSVSVLSLVICAGALAHQPRLVKRGNLEKTE